MVSGASGLHINGNWGVSGFGRNASRFILDKRAADAQAQRDAEMMAQMEAMNAAHRDQMDSMMAMYTQEPSTISKSAPYAVGTGGNASLTASAASKRKLKSSPTKTFGRGGTGFQSTLNAAATGSAATGSAASLSVNV